MASLIYIGPDSACALLGSAQGWWHACSVPRSYRRVTYHLPRAGGQMLAVHLIIIHPTKTRPSHQPLLYWPNWGPNNSRVITTSTSGNPDCISRTFFSPAVSASLSSLPVHSHNNAAVSGLLNGNAKPPNPRAEVRLSDRDSEDILAGYRAPKKEHPRLLGNSAS
ncbi:hypothetical protein J6590_032656 [Homalodisca vitripennis]|nr:hypothetical protein J6590_032656 [Homalodisca vitripennis]